MTCICFKQYLLKNINRKGEIFMARYIVKRVLLAIASIFIICAITFFAMNAIPGGPFNSEKALSEATRQVLEQRYNLDKPVPVQFILYLRNLLRGDFGVSLKTGRASAPARIASVSSVRIIPVV